MKVALLSSVCEIAAGAGAAAVAQYIAKELSARGHQVIVITTHPKSHLAVERTNGITVYRFFPCNLYWVGHKDRQQAWKKVLWQLIDIWNPHAFRIVRDILAQERPDVLHVQKLRGLSPAIWSAARAVGISGIVQTCHDYELMSPEGALSSRVGQWALRGAWMLRPYQRIRAQFSKLVTDSKIRS